MSLDRRTLNALRAADKAWRAARARKDPEARYVEEPVLPPPTPVESVEHPPQGESQHLFDPSEFDRP